MMVEAAILGIEQRAGAECLNCSGAVIAAEVMLGQNFIQMREVVFASAVSIVRLKMIEGGKRPAMVEGVGGIGKNDDDMSAGANYASPFAQRGEGVGHVF